VRAGLWFCVEGRVLEVGGVPEGGLWEGVGVARALGSWMTSGQGRRLVSSMLPGRMDVSVLSRMEVGGVVRAWNQASSATDDYLCWWRVVDRSGVVGGG